jgi:translation initiation factor IF-1
MKKISISYNSRLVSEWHPVKNGDLSPNDLSPYSNKKVWWKCKQGHEWEAIIAHRSNGSGCPYCSGRRANPDNCLQKRNSELSKEWHPHKNGSMTPNDVTMRSGRKVWWRCEKGHEWTATIYSRTGGNGCPYCSGRYTLSEGSLQALNSNLAKQWHSSNNGELTPNDVTIGSDKKVWWKCEKGHEWEARISNRVKGRGCPFCSGKKTCTDNCLQVLYPELSNDWHPTKNGDLTPNDVTAFSGKRVWWQCKNGHEWQAAIANRTRGRGCPYCYKMKKIYKEVKLL